MPSSFNGAKFLHKIKQILQRNLTAPGAWLFVGVFALQAFGLNTQVYAQSIFAREKQKWMDRDGELVDGRMNLGYNFLAWFAKGTQEEHYNEVRQAIDNLLNGDSWQNGNYASALIGTQLYYCFGDRLHAAERQKLLTNLENIPTDQYYFGNTTSNTGINTMTARYIMSQHAKNKTVRYSDPSLIYGPPNFTYNGRTYTRGNTYSSYELSRDYLYSWFERYVDAGYLQGELFSEIYTMHFINSLVTLTDSRMVQDPEMRQRAKLAADFFLLEHVANTNDHHLAGPLGRSYMQLHLDGSRHLLYWDCYWGKMYPTHYGHPDGPFILEYRVTPLIEDIGRYNDEPADYWHVVRATTQGERYIFIAKDFTLGSNPDGGNWLLEINSNDPGPYPKARPGSPFRIWMNEYPDDLNPDACEGECYSQMGTHAHQYKNALLMTLGGARLYEALTTNRWDIVENHSSGWRFSQEGRVAVAIRRGGSSAALEVARLGIDYPSLDEFKNAILTRAKLEGNVFVTSKGDRIEARYNNTTQALETYVNGQDHWRNTPRLEVATHRGEKVVEWQNNVMTLRKHGRTGIYDFNRWTYREADDGGVVDRDPPKTPAGFKVSQ